MLRFPCPPGLIGLVALIGPPLLGSATAFAHPDRFLPLDEKWPTPSESRLGSGYPGPAYWQQRADYDIQVSLDEDTRSVIGSETITYYNRSPHTLRYLWLQLDNNIFSRDSDAALAQQGPDFDEFHYDSLARLLATETFDGTLKLDALTNEADEPLRYKVVKTLLRVDLLDPLAPGGVRTLKIRWHNAINDATVIRARTGYEPFENGNDIFEIAHFYPRMAAYSELRGWHNDQFLGRGEFTLEFGDYRLQITAPADHVVAASGVLQNPTEVLNPEQIARLEQAKSATDPVFIVTPEEAKENEATRSKNTKTWIYEAKQVRDVAWASSRKFIWDALGVLVHEHVSPKDTVGPTTSPRVVLAMSYYPNEAEPLWSSYSTRAVAHTIDVYGKFTFPYPYPIAISVNGPVMGMEYPMICFNGPRPEEDGTYYGAPDKKWWKWRNSKYGLISVIIHEVGHNWFPMIVNSDERRWTWMDEGLNTFLQFLAEQEWSEDYPSSRGFPPSIVDYMLSDYQVPIMSTSDSLLQFGSNAYGKPATALNILRETILGRELFDHAFKLYAQSWKFKRPTPYDFFRVMEDASGIDLDWFFRGWFYTTDHVDIELTDVRRYTLNTQDPRIDNPIKKQEEEEEPKTITKIRNEGMKRLVEKIESLKDFYDDYDPYEVTDKAITSYEELLESLDEEEKELLKTHREFTEVEFRNKGGLVMPIIVRLTYEDSTSEVIRIPAHIWRRAPSHKVKKLFMSASPIVKVEVDPFLETADVNPYNHDWPKRVRKTRFDLFKQKKDPSPMKEALEAETSSTSAAASQ